MTNCKQCGERRAQWTRGPLAGLCEECAKPLRERMRAGARNRHAADPVPADAPEEKAGYEAKAKQLVGVGRRVDTALARVQKHRAKGAPLERDVREAVNAWRDTLRKLAE